MSVKQVNILQLVLLMNLGVIVNIFNMFYLTKYSKIQTVLVKLGHGQMYLQGRRTGNHKQL